jgi:hypothetical protein
MNLSNTALEEMGDAAAHATVTLAQRTPAADRPRGNGSRVPRFTLPKPAPRTAQ